MKSVLLVSLFFLNLPSAWAQLQGGREIHRLTWIGLTRPWTFNAVKGWLNSSDSSIIPASAVKVTAAPLGNTADKLNPYSTTNFDFAYGNYLPDPRTVSENQYVDPNSAPDIEPQDANWFADQVAQQNSPDIFVIGGHHVISEGYHNHEETNFLFIPTLLKAVRQYPAIRSYFDQVKVAILWGCNTLTNLEPHDSRGQLLSPQQIKSIYDSGEAGKKAMLGSGKEINTLEFYRERLAREYGPGTHEYAYTRGPQREKCKGPHQYENCEIADLDRIMPDYGLFDGSHRYNEAYKMKKLFRNAYLVLGFSSASPNEENRVKILKDAVERASKKLGLTGGASLRLISSDYTDLATRKRAITALRDSWEESTFRMNRGRPSGSITPAFPEIDQGKVVPTVRTTDKQIYSTYMP